MTNPITILRQLNRRQWQFFFVGFIAWAWDAFDFFTVSLCLTEIATEFNRSNADVSWGITITLMLRSVGAIIFGSLSDRYGRKWTMICNLCLFIVLELGSGFCATYEQFIAVRGLYGIAMGGLFGPAAATALEDLPYSARGVLSGIFEQGYAVGFLLAAIFYRALVPTTPHGWRSLFWFGSGPPVLIIIFRLCLPETDAFKRQLARRKAAASKEPTTSAKLMRVYLKESRAALKKDGILLIYLIVLMSGMNSVSHGSQDLYATFLKNQLGFGSTLTTVTTVVGQIGALVGGGVLGYMSTFFGRRLTIIVGAIVGGALIPAYIIPKTGAIMVGTFFEQVCVGGTWGVIPIHLMELASPEMRIFVMGVTYQLGNLASSASATIEATIGARYPLSDGPGGLHRYNYGKVIAIFLGAVWAYILVFIFLGPEMKQSDRDAEEALMEKHDLAAAAGEEFYPDETEGKVEPDHIEKAYPSV